MDNSAAYALKIIKMMANSEFDAEAYEKSNTFRTICRYQECMAENPDEGSDATFQYWWKRGLKKELHDTQQDAYKWASYVPRRYVEGYSDNRRYPLLFILHGANNPIYLAETYGYTHIAAREELIAIIPENESAASIEYLLNYADEHYPVDRSRIYMVGYSLGGLMTSRHALRWPERFAAVGVGGMLFSNGSITSYWHHGTEWPGEAITEEMIVRAAEIKIPVCECMGEPEFTNLLPILRDQSPFNQQPASKVKDCHPDPYLDLTAKNKLASVNNWRRIAGCLPISEQDVAEAARYSPDIVTEKLGFPFERTHVVNYEGRSHYIGDCVNPDGEILARFICMGKSAHWPCAALTELTWDFIRRFARDTNDGHLIRVNS